jgi:hypothetical protein
MKMNSLYIPPLHPTAALAIMLLGSLLLAVV